MSEEQKKRRVLGETAALLKKQGARKTSMEDIAAYAHVSKVTVYKYFGDKNGVLDAVCAWLTAECLQRLGAETSASPAARMAGFIRVLTEFMNSGEQALCAQLSAYTDGARAAYTNFEKQVRGMIEALIHEGKRAGMIEAALGDDCVYHYIQMGLRYYECDAAYRERLHADAQFRDAFMGLIWRNIFTAEALRQIQAGLF